MQNTASESPCKATKGQIKPFKEIVYNSEHTEYPQYR